MGKEIRALAPAWLACLATLGVAVAMGQPSLAVAVLFLAPTVLGALSMGHEFSARTLSLLLSQPRRRERIFFLKFGVLVAAITTLSALELVLAGGRPVQDQPLMFVLPVLCGL